MTTPSVICERIVDSARFSFSRDPKGSALAGALPFGSRLNGEVFPFTSRQSAPLTHPGKSVCTS
jgi:hypothetical protein